MVVVALVAVALGDLFALTTISGRNGGADASTAPVSGHHRADDPAQRPDGGSNAPSIPPSDARQPAGSDGSGPGRASAGQATKDGWDFTATLSPLCASVGGAFTLTLGVGAEGLVALVAMYADGNSYNTTSVGQAGADGVYRYSWVAPPAVGHALVAITAGDRSGQKAGKKTIPFTVVGLGEKC